MPLQTQNIDLRFASGVDTKTDQNNVLFASFQELKESRIDKIGAVIPRGGFVAGANIYPAAGYPSFALASNGTYTVVGTNSSVRVQTPTTSSSIGYNVKGGFLRIAAGRAIPFTSGTAAGGGMVCHAWQIPNTEKIGVLVLSTNTNEVIIRTELPLIPYRDAAGSRIHVVYSNSAFVIFFRAETITPGTQQIQAWTFPITNFTPADIAAWRISSGPAFPSGTVIRFDVTSIDNNVYIAYALNDSTTVSVLKIVDNGVGNRVSTSANILTMDAKAVCVAIQPSTGYTNQALAVFSGSSSGLMKAAAIDTSLAVVGTRNSTAPASPPTTDFKRCHVVVHDGVAVCKFDYEYSNFIRSSYIRLGPDFGSSSYNLTPSGATMVTGSIVVDNVPYSIYDADTPTTYGSHVLARLGTTPDREVISGAARFASGKNLGQQWSSVEVGSIPRPVTVGAKIYFPIDVVTGIESLEAGNTAVASVVEAVAVTPYVTASLLQWDTSEVLPTAITVENNEALYLGSASRDVGAFEGPGVPWPECTMRDYTMSKVSGTTAPVGQVSYVFAKLYTSPSGVEYRTYSTIYLANFTAINQTLQATIPADSTKASYYTPATLELYRTERNGSIFYRCATNITLTYVNGVATFTDTRNEADLLNQRIADISGDELYPEPIPALRAVTQFKARLAYVDCDDPTIVKFDRGSMAPAGSTTASGISVEAPAEGGPITALQQMDGALYIFKSNSIWTVYGDVPSSTGQGGTLSTPSLVFNGVGCSDSRSVVLTSKGILFKGAKGVYLLMRNQELNFLGQGPYADRQIKIVGSGIGETQAEAYFVHANGQVWVLNLDLNAWYEWSYSQPIRAGVVANGALTVLSDTQIAQISTSSVVDQPLSPAPATSITQDIVTGWLRTDGIQGFHRLKKVSFLIDALAATTLTIDVYTDYNDTTPTQTVIVNTNDLALSAAGNRAFEMHIKQQKAACTKFRIRTNGYGVKFSGATLAVAVKSGLAKNTSNTY